MGKYRERITKLAVQVIKLASLDFIVKCPYYKDGIMTDVKYDESNGFLTPCQSSIDGEPCKKYFVDFNKTWGTSGDFDKDRQITSFKCLKMGDVNLSNNNQMGDVTNVVNPTISSEQQK